METPKTASESDMPILNLRKLGLLSNEFKHAHGTGEHPDHPVLRIGKALACRLQRKSPLTGEVSALVGELEKHAEETHICYLAAFIGNTDVEANRTFLKEVLRQKTKTDNAEGKVSAEEFAARINNLYSPVLTGHPTYRKNTDRDQAMADVVAYKSGSKEHGPETKARLAETRKTPYNPPNMKDEWAQNLAKLHNIHTARKIVRDVAMKVAMEEYPDDWHKMNYAPVSVGTWMFYDWDGRKDISWNMAAENRFLLKERMLTDYLPQLQEVKDRLGAGDAAIVGQIIKKFNTTITLEKSHREFCASYDTDKDKSLQQLSDWNKRLVGDKAERVIHPRETVEALQSILECTTDQETREMLVRLRSDLTTQGISYAVPHFRISSTSVLDAFNEKYGMDIGDCESTDNTHSDRVEKLLQATTPKQNNFLDVAQSNMAVMTQMTLARQIVDEIDGHCPIRYLVAETHNASTIKAVLQLAKETGVHHHTNITPLIEDEQGSRASEEIMYILYQSEAYRDHVIGPRPHNPAQNIVAIQLGYSDFAIGKTGVNSIPAAAFHEHGITRYANIHADAKIGMPQVPLVIFHTGGHFMGRGLHPGSIAQSQEYLSPHYFLAAVQSKNVRLTIERSFQGGSGQAVLGTAPAALADLTQSLSYLADNHRRVPKDPYYHGQQRAALAFFEQVKDVHRRLGAQSNYITQAAMFKNFIPVSGSRPAVAQIDGAAGLSGFKLRAILFNAAVMQTGIADNVLYGVGKAIENDPDTFNALANESPFFRQTRLGPVVRALQLSDAGIRESYIKLYDPAFWIDRARHSHEKTERDNNFAVVGYLKKFGLYNQFKDIVGDIAMDVQKTRDHFQSTGLINHPDFDKPTLKISPAQIANTEIAHGMRIYAMIQLFSLAASIPEISESNGISKEKMVERILCLDPKAIEELETIFNRKLTINDNLPTLDVKPSDFSASAGYTGLAETHIGPMRGCREIIGRTAHVVADYVGGVG